MAKAVIDKPEYRIGLSNIYISYENDPSLGLPNASTILPLNSKSEVTYVLTWVIPMSDDRVVGVFSSFSAAKAAVRQVAEKLIDEMNEMFCGDNKEGQTEDSLYFRITETIFHGDS